MADDPTPEPEPGPKPGTRERRTKIAEAADAISDGAEKLARMTPQHMVNLVCIIALTAIVCVFAFKAWQEAEERKAERKANEETHAAQIRENNAQMELTRQHCSNENATTRREAREESERVRRDANDNLQKVVTAFLTEGERQRTFQAGENEKMRAAVVSALKKVPND